MRPLSLEVTTLSISRSRSRTARRPSLSSVDLLATVRLKNQPSRSGSFVDYPHTIREESDCKAETLLLIQLTLGMVAPIEIARFACPVGRVTVSGPIFKGNGLIAITEVLVPGTTIPGPFSDKNTLNARIASRLTIPTYEDILCAHRPALLKK